MPCIPLWRVRTLKALYRIPAGSPCVWPTDDMTAAYEERTTPACFDPIRQPIPPRDWARIEKMSLAGERPDSSRGRSAARRRPAIGIQFQRRASAVTLDDDLEEFPRSLHHAFRLDDSSGSLRSGTHESGQGRCVHDFL